MSTPPQPGPVEASILAELAPTFTARFVDCDAVPRSRVGGAPVQAAPSPVPLRVLEGGEGPPLVLLHGRGGAATSWFSLLLPLALRFHVYAVDLPGFGSSSAPVFSGSDFDAGADFFTTPVEAWLDSERIHAPTVIGHSLGGLVAVELALRRRIAPRRLMLIGGMGLGPQMTYTSRLFFRAGPERSARRLGKTLWSRLMPATADTPDGRRRAALDYELCAASERVEASRAFDALYPTFGGVPHRLSRLHEITAPTLVLWGDHDEVFPSPVAIAAAAALPRGELRIDPLGHSPHQEAPEQVLTTIFDFLGATPSMAPARG